MHKRLLIASLLAASLAGGAFAAPGPSSVASVNWPTPGQQLKAHGAQPGTALEKLILANQDFGMLRPEEANDRIPVPLWLRVHWRKHHPEAIYSGADPTGGYPHVLKEVAEWMRSHPDLVPTRADEWRAPGEDDDADAGIAGADADADAGTKNLPEKTTIHRNIRISGRQDAPRSESDIRINFWNPKKIIAASNNFSGTGQQAEYWSTDGGATWGQSFLPLATGDLFHSDPTVDWTSDGTAWSMTIGINGQGTELRLRSYKSTDGGATWVFDDTFSGDQTFADKEMLWVDHSSASPYRNHIYVCWHNGDPAFVNHRTGPRGSWGKPLRVSGPETRGTAIGCDVKTNAAGDAFVFWPATGSRGIVVAKSTDGGLKWGTPTVIATTFVGYDIGIPAMARRRLLIYTSGAAYRTASLNMVYASWVDLSGEPGCNSRADQPNLSLTSACKTRVWFARSADGGATWSAPAMVNNQRSNNDQFNQWLGVDDTTGRLALIYYDTVGGASRKKTDVWYQTSGDNGATWSPAAKVTTLQSNETGARAEPYDQYGDYNSLSIYAGRIFPSWTDRRGSDKEEIWTAPITEP
jgi:hypothetical protein